MKQKRDIKNNKNKNKIKVIDRDQLTLGCAVPKILKTKTGDVSIFMITISSHFI